MIEIKEMTIAKEISDPSQDDLMSGWICGWGPCGGYACGEFCYISGHGCGVFCKK